MCNIGIDASSGDNGESVVLDSIIGSLNDFNDVHFFVFGNENSIVEYFKNKHINLCSCNVSVVNCEDRIEMNDHPVFAIREKVNSSIVKAGKMLKNNEIDAFISAGSTGALVAMSQFIVKPVSGVDRPVLGSILPTLKEPLILTDSGCNVDSKPEWLFQYAILSMCYYKFMFDVQSPSIGLLSVGTEENKGNRLTLDTYKLIKNDARFNFIGNVEARDLPQGICNIVITDGFAGNVFLKTYEGTASMIIGLVKEQLKSSFLGKIGGLLIKKNIKKIMKKYDASKYGGAPILGASSLIIKCHGNSKFNEFFSAIKQAKDLVDKQFILNIKKAFEV